MTDCTLGRDTCPLCHRPRRDSRPLCNTHLRRVGPTLLETYFTQAKAAAKSQTPTAPVHAALRKTIDAMIAHARGYDDIKAGGRRPIWDAGRWQDPRANAAAASFCTGSPDTNSAATTSTT